MQQFLVTGYALYAVAAVCGLGVLCKWVTRIFYKRLIKEAGNLAMTKNKNLKALKQKIETVYRTNAGMANMSAYLEQCRRQGERMVVLTSSVPVHCRTALEHLGLRPYFERLIFA